MQIIIDTLHQWIRFNSIVVWKIHANKLYIQNSEIFTDYKISVKYIVIELEFFFRFKMYILEINCKPIVLFINIFDNVSKCEVIIYFEICAESQKLSTLKEKIKISRALATRFDALE